MATAMLSAITKTPVRADVAMTGEITLRGRVLPIGGLKEKTLAAKNAGIKTICVPKKNEKDVEEISPEIKRGYSPGGILNAFAWPLAVYRKQRVFIVYCVDYQGI